MPQDPPRGTPGPPRGTLSQADLCPPHYVHCSTVAPYSSSYFIQSIAENFTCLEESARTVDLN